MSKKVRDAMHMGVVWMSPDTPVAELARKMRDDDIGSIPIGENDRLIGMVTDRDIVCRAVADGGSLASLKARDVMTPDIIYCRDSDDLDDATELMEEKQVRRLPVIDKNKRMVGILSVGDVAQEASHKEAGELIAAVSAHHE